MRRNGSRRSRRSAPEQALEAIDGGGARAAAAALLLAAATGRRLFATCLRFGDAEPLLERAADALPRLRFRQVGRRSAVVDLVFERVEGPDQMHGHREA